MRFRTVLAALALLASGAADARAASSTPTWDRVIHGSARFRVLSGFAGEAVLDKETGLVWEKAPSADFSTWNAAVLACTGKIVGGRFGWRLPAIEELSSLVDPSQGALGVSPPLPEGHPFENVTPGGVFWAVTSDQTTAGAAYRMAIVVAGGFHGFVSSALKTQSNVRAWCVRGGGQGVDGM